MINFLNFICIVFILTYITKYSYKNQSNEESVQGLKSNLFKILSAYGDATQHICAPAHTYTHICIRVYICARYFLQSTQHENWWTTKANRPLVSSDARIIFVYLLCPIRSNRWLLQAQREQINLPILLLRRSWTPVSGKIRWNNDGGAREGFTPRVTKKAIYEGQEERTEGGERRNPDLHPRLSPSLLFSKEAWKGSQFCSSLKERFEGTR